MLSTAEIAWIYLNSVNRPLRLTWIWSNTIIHTGGYIGVISLVRPFTKISVLLLCVAGYKTPLFRYVSMHFKKASSRVSNIFGMGPRKDEHHVWRVFQFRNCHSVNSFLRLEIVTLWEWVKVCGVIVGTCHSTYNFGQWLNEKNFSCSG